MVCHTSSPAAIDKAPKLIPYAPVAIATDAACWRARVSSLM